MKDLEKLEFIHGAIQRAINLIPDLDEEIDSELYVALELVEQLQSLGRLVILQEPDDDEEPRVPWLTRGELWALEQKDKKDD